jgi:hypothetical protein
VPPRRVVACALSGLGRASPGAALGSPLCSVDPWLDKAIAAPSIGQLSRQDLLKHEIFDADVERLAPLRGFGESPGKNLLGRRTVIR